MLIQEKTTIRFFIPNHMYVHLYNIHKTTDDVFSFLLVCLGGIWKIPFLFLAARHLVPVSFFAL